MTNARTGRTRFSLVLLTIGGFCGVVVACGDGSRPEASGGSQSPPARLSIDESLENRAPEITSIRFEPANAIPGKPLRVRVGTTDPDRDQVELEYTWKINGRRALSSDSMIALSSNLRKGDRIEVSVIASDGEANSETAIRTIRVRNRPPSLQGIEIHVQGDEDGGMGYWVADPSARDPDDDEITFRYSWIVNGVPLDVDAAELARASRRRGDEVRLVVWAMDGEAESAPLRSASFSIGNSPPDIDSRPPSMDPSGRFVYSVKASDRDGDRGLRYSLEQGPEGMVIDAVSGELRWQASARNAGEHIVVIAVDDRQGGVTRQRFYVQVETGPANQQ